MTFSGYLNVFNFQRVLLAARKADAIALYFMHTIEEKTYLNSLNFRTLGLRENKKGAKRSIFAHFDARKLMGARNSEISFTSRKIFFKVSDFILTMSKGSFLIREAHQAEHKERLRSRKQYL